MSVNKVQLANGETIIDISDSTVTPETLAEGVTAHDASGQKITGKMIPGGGSFVQTDWNQTDETQPDFLKNKPFGDYPVVAMEEQEVQYDAEFGACMGNLSSPINVGDTLAVVFDGEQYVCTTFTMEGQCYFGNSSLVGGNDTGEPFMGMAMGDVVAILATDTKNHIVKITGLAAEKIPERFYNNYIPLFLKMGESAGYLYIDQSTKQRVTTKELMQIVRKAPIVICYAIMGVRIDGAEYPQFISTFNDVGYVETSEGTYYAAEYTPTT